MDPWQKKFTQTPMSLLSGAGVDGLDVAEISAASGFIFLIKRDCLSCGPHDTVSLLSVSLLLSTSAALTGGPAMAELAPCDGSTATRLRTERKEKKENVSLAAPSS